jgi:hypothetical protein
LTKHDRRQCEELISLVVITDKQRGELTDVLGRAIAATRRIHQRNQPHPASLGTLGPRQQEDYMAQSPQKPPEKSISDQAFQNMTDEQRRQEQQRRAQPESTPPEDDGSSQNKYPGTGSPS